MRIFYGISVGFFILSVIQGLHSQIPIGHWRDHLPYNRTIKVVDDGKTIYCATPYSIFTYDKSDQSVRRISKLNGLSDIGISSMAFNEAYSTIIIAYSNTNIDLIKNGKVINIPDIKRKPILGNKTINNITIRDSLAYLSCGFGIVVLDIKNEEFPEPTYYIGPEGSQVNVQDITFSPDSIYAATTTGIFKASLSSPNLADFNFWSKEQRLYPTGNFDHICYFNNHLVVNLNKEGFATDTVFKYNFLSKQWSILPNSSRLKKFGFSVFHNQFIEITETGLQIYNNQLERVAVLDKAGGYNLQTRDVWIDKNNFYWIADNYLGLVATDGNQNTFLVIPNGPLSHRAFDMALSDQKLWVASGGRTPTWGKMYIADGVYSFINEQWNTFNGGTGHKAFDTINDMTCIAINPLNTQQVYVGTWLEGVIEITNNQVTNVFSKHNSTLQIWPVANFVAVSGLAFDRNGNLWVVNSGANNLLSVKKPDGTWRSFNLGSAASSIDASQIFIDRLGQKWILVRADHKLIVFTDKGTIDNPSDDEVKILSNAPGNGNLPGNKIYSIAEDHDGRIWLGTDQGIGVIYTPGNIFTGGNYDAQRILVEVGGYVQYLLETEVVTSIAIDGDNRKWIGTERAGAFLLSPGGTTQIYHFTEENSPIISNFIIDIAIDHKTGEVFFATAKGIVSFRGTATEPGDNHSDVVVFPNPVRENYRGVIAISGLVHRADVKITDISGKLVYSTRAEGGQAIWDGNDLRGRRVNSGVYLIFSSDEYGTEKMVSKILFIK